jgi:hypothetical protein
MLIAGIAQALAISNSNGFLQPQKETYSEISWSGRLRLLAAWQSILTEQKKPTTGAPL